MSWPTNRWCGSSAGLLQSAHHAKVAGHAEDPMHVQSVGAVKRHVASGHRSFLGTALVQQSASLVRAGLIGEEL